MNGWGDFTAVGALGQRYGLIGHDSRDVWAWLAEHPDFAGNIHFDNRDGGDQIDVTDEFLGEDAMRLPSPILSQQEKAA
jgi:hypothetical protein